MFITQKSMRVFQEKMLRRKLVSRGLPYSYSLLCLDD